MSEHDAHRGAHPAAHVPGRDPAATTSSPVPIRASSGARRALLLGVALIAAAGGGAWWMGWIGVPAREQQARPAPRPPAVVAATARAEPVDRPTEHLGRVEAPRAVDVRPRATGTIRELRFAEGSRVKAGDVLFVIDPSTYEAEYASVQAQLVRAQAGVGEIESRLNRTRELRRGDIAPQAQLDQVQAELATARAGVRVAEAAVQTAALNLSFTRVQAPFDGQVGRALFQLGALVGPDSGALVRLVQTDPVRVVFSLTEAELVTLRQARAAGEPRAERRLRLRLPNGSDLGTEGQLDFVDSEVSPNTGTVALRATFNNPDRLLVPGQYVTMLVSPRDPEVLPVVPFSAVMSGRDGQRVFVLDGDTARERKVELGERVASGWSVRDGLRAGERVVVEGTGRVRDGTAVRATEARAAPPAGAPAATPVSVPAADNAPAATPARARSDAPAPSRG